MRFRVVVLGLMVGCFGFSRSADACGGGGVTLTKNTRGAVADRQVVLFSVHDDGTTDIVVQIGVPATNADYGVLIPVPSEPTLDDTPVSAEDLAALDASTQPRVTMTYDYEDRESSGCGCLEGGDDDDSGNGNPMANGVTVGTPVNLGPVTAVSLTGTDTDAVNGWLADNGFGIPDDQLGLLDAYVGDGRYFIAVKRNDSTADGAPSSIGLHYSLEGDYRQLSLAFARLGAAPTVAFTVFVAGPSSMYAAPSAPWTFISLADLSPLRLRLGDYTGAVKEAVEIAGSRAFVFEYAGTPTSGSFGYGGRPALTSRLRGLFDADQYVSRFSTVLSSSALTEDAGFYDTAPAPLFFRTVVRDVRTVRAKYASAGWVVALVTGGLLRRRARSRKARNARR